MFGDRNIQKDIFPLMLARTGQEVIVQSITGGRGLRARLKDMGLNEGMKLRVLQAHSFGPCVVLVGNTRLVLGRGMSHRIFVRHGTH